MKHILFSISFFLSTVITFSQGWQATNLTNVNYLSIGELETFNGELYATIFNGLNSTVHKLDAGNTSWTQISVAGVTGNPSYMKQATSKFYMGTVGLIESNLYESTDGINYTLADTTGLPQETGGFSRMYGLEYFNGYLMLNLGSAGYWLKNDNQNNWYHINTPTALNGGVDPVAYMNGKLYAFDNSGNIAFYVSDDYGSNWTTVTTDLPSGFNANKLVSNNGGRLFVDGTWGSSDYGLFYSDNEGVNWTQLDISSFITTDYNGGQQTITALYADGQTLYFSLENDQSFSAPNIVGTSTGIQNLAEDTVGLPINASGAVNGLYFTQYQGQLAMSLNVIDVYLRGLSTTINESVSKPDINLFPNPVNDILTISSNDAEPESIDVVNSLGQIVISEGFFTNKLDVSDLNVGIYFIRFNSGNKVLNTKRFVKK